jgi:hypothetical protein
VDSVRLVYGVGATKAGSGWLYRFLRAHPDCHLRTIKELHFFDTLEFGRTNARLRKLDRGFDLLNARNPEGAKRDSLVRDFQDWMTVAKTGDTADYLRYLSDGRGSRTVVADITPAYSLVSQRSLRVMAGVLPDTRFVFLMRDPVARLWSHVRMIARRASARGGADPVQLAASVLDRALTGQEPNITSRGAYDSILPRLRAVVPAAGLFVDFFEDIVPPSATDRLCAFLGIAPRKPLARRPHEGLDIPLADDQRARIRNYLAPQYDFVRSDMGRLPAAWQVGAVAGPGFRSAGVP